MTPVPYRGRFAPSPTGPLHFGSLVAALGSWLEARAQHGQWLLRIEDLDRPREEPGAAHEILSALEACGLEWDAEPTFQSRRSTLYAAAFERLQRDGAVFACACSRREIADSALLPDREPVYPGTCRHGLPAGRPARAWRVRAGHDVIEFVDAVQGSMRQHLAKESGDFVIKRADGFFAYQLAVVVDDAEQGITDVVRGADLLDSTPRQVRLQYLLGLQTPRYAHLPVAVTAAGEKLSKQTHAAPIARGRCAGVLVNALDFLGQQPPPSLARATSREVLAWAREHWSLARVPRTRTRQIPAGTNP